MQSTAHYSRKYSEVFLPQSPKGWCNLSLHHLYITNRKIWKFQLKNVLDNSKVKNSKLAGSNICLEQHKMSFNGRHLYDVFCTLWHFKLKSYRHTLCPISINSSVFKTLLYIFSAFRRHLLNVKVVVWQNLEILSRGIYVKSYKRHYYHGVDSPPNFFFFHFLKFLIRI